VAPLSSPATLVRNHPKPKTFYTKPHYFFTLKSKFKNQILKDSPIGRIRAKSIEEKIPLLSRSVLLLSFFSFFSFSAVCGLMCVCVVRWFWIGL
jgi:hypothetical protein